MTTLMRNKHEKHVKLEQLQKQRKTEKNRFGKQSVTTSIAWSSASSKISFYNPNISHRIFWSGEREKEAKNDSLARSAKKPKRVKWILHSSATRSWLCTQRQRGTQSPFATDRIKQKKAGQLIHVDEAAKAMTHCGQPITRERRVKQPSITEEATTNAHGTNQPGVNVKISS